MWGMTQAKVKGLEGRKERQLRKVTTIQVNHTVC